MLFLSNKHKRNHWRNDISGRQVKWVFTILYAGLAVSDLTPKEIIIIGRKDPSLATDWGSRKFWIKGEMIKRLVGYSFFEVLTNKSMNKNHSYLLKWFRQGSFTCGGTMVTTCVASPCVRCTTVPLEQLLGGFASFRFSVAPFTVKSTEPFERLGEVMLLDEEEDVIPWRATVFFPVSPASVWRSENSTWAAKPAGVIWDSWARETECKPPSAEKASGPVLTSGCWLKAMPLGRKNQLDLGKILRKPGSCLEVLREDWEKTQWRKLFKIFPQNSRQQ